jgi:hypothetical protein
MTADARRASRFLTNLARAAKQSHSSACSRYSMAVIACLLATRAEALLISQPLELAEEC